MTKKLRPPSAAPLIIGAGLVSMPVMAMLLEEQQAAAPPPPAAAQADPGAADAPPARPVIPPAYIVTEWERLTSATAEPSLSSFTAFLRDHPGFPNEIELKQRAERLIDVATPMADRLAYFAVSEPITATGKFRYAEALLASGRQAKAVEMAREAWRSGGIAEADRPLFLATFGPSLQPEDHAERADRLLWADDQGGALALLGSLPEADRRLMLARVALKRASRRGANMDAEATAAVDAVPESLQRHPGIIADRYEFYRFTGRSGYARQLLADTRIAPGSAGDRNEWMKLHLTAAQGAVRDKRFELAYDIAAHHGGLPFDHALLDNPADERDTFTSLEWLAGWTALHELNRPLDAIRHFQNFANAARFAQTRSRGLYWAARSAEAAGRADAQGLYRSAASFPLTFYGQLASEKLGEDVRIAETAPPAPSPAERAAFNADPRVEAVKIYGRQGDKGKQRLFLQTLADEADYKQLAMVAELANRYGHERIAVLNTRGVRADGPPAIVSYSYPRRTLPREIEHQWTMVHALTRQESQFELDARSPAGARGLMQLMPATARETAGKIGLGYDVSRLTTDGDYNIRLGSAYFARLVDRWTGNHVLAIASYNAGPGNVNRWIRENGDPRLPNVDVVEWIENIPFYETRTYVRAVLENAVVYDALDPARRRGGPQTARLSWYLGKSRTG